MRRRFPYAGNTYDFRSRGLLKGAVMEGAAGHFAGHHGNLGAAGGLRIQP